jgi:hypothetical protein
MIYQHYQTVCTVAVSWYSPVTYDLSGKANMHVRMHAWIVFFHALPALPLYIC